MYVLAQMFKWIHWYTPEIVVKTQMHMHLKNVYCFPNVYVITLCVFLYNTLVLGSSLILLFNKCIFSLIKTIIGKLSTGTFSLAICYKKWWYTVISWL